MSTRKPKTEMEFELAIWRLTKDVSSNNPVVRDKAIAKRIKLREELAALKAAKASDD